MTVDWLRLAGLLMALVLAFSALRRNPFGWRKQLVMAAVWGLIVVAAALVFKDFRR